MDNIEHIELKSLSPTLSFERVHVEPDKIKINAKLLQKFAFPKKHIAVVLFNGVMLRFLFLKPKRPKKNFSIDLAYINPKAQQAMNFSWPWAIALAASVIGALVCLSMQIPLLYVSGFLPLIGICSFGLAKGMYPTYYFYSLHGKVKVFELVPCPCNKKMFDAFMRIVVMKTEQANKKNRQYKSELLKKEMKFHRLLYENKLISNGDYEKAKHRILKSY